MDMRTTTKIAYTNQIELNEYADLLDEQNVWNKK